MRTTKTGVRVGFGRTGVRVGFREKLTLTPVFDPGFFAPVFDHGDLGGLLGPALWSLSVAACDGYAVGLGARAARPVRKATSAIATSVFPTSARVV